MSEVTGAILRAGIYQVVVKPVRPDADLRTWYKRTVGQEAPETMFQYTVTRQGEHVAEGTADTQENAIFAAGQAVGEDSARRTDAAMREVDRLMLADLDSGRREAPDFQGFMERQQVSEMDGKPAGMVRVYESRLVSPMGPCQSLAKRMQAVGIDAMVWQPKDNSGEVIYVWDRELEAARTWLQENIYG